MDLLQGTFGLDKGLMFVQFILYQNGQNKDFKL